MKYCLILFLSVLGNAALAAPSDELIRQVAQSKQWQKLLHYEKHWFTKKQSSLDGRGFFMAPNGDVDAEAELRATVLAMQSPDMLVSKLKQHPQCAFPARKQFIEKSLEIKFTPMKCDLFERFMANFHDPKSASIIFSSAYPNNPASMFGHTFIKIQASRNNDLLDNGLNFAALVGSDEGSIPFAWNGTVGGYRGVWSTQPYYVKVNEYTHFESRDLWEYELNLSADEVKQVIAHVWELETNSYFDYYFFDENCSYQILTAIVAIRPEWEKVTDHLIYIVPGETIKSIMQQPGMVRSVKFRPSSHHLIHQRYAALNAEEKREFFAIIEDEKDPSLTKSRFIIDAVIAYYDYQRNEDKETYKKKYEKRRESLLNYRSTLGVVTQEELNRLPALHTNTQPELAHDSYMASLGAGWHGRENEDGEYFNFRAKSSYHDLLNKDLGFNRFSHIDFPWIDLQYDKISQQVRLEELGGVAITSLHPMTSIDQRMSWRLRTGMFTARDYGCDTCRHLSAELMSGAATALGSYRLLGYALVGARVELYHRLNRGYRYGPQVELGLLAQLGDNYKAHLSAIERWDIGQRGRSDSVTSLQLGHAYSLSRNRELRQSNLLHVPMGHSDLNWWESKLEVLFFFR